MSSSISRRHLARIAGSLPLSYGMLTGLNQMGALSAVAQGTDAHTSYQQANAAPHTKPSMSPAGAPAPAEDTGPDTKPSAPRSHPK